MNVIIALLLFLDIFSTVPVSNGELGNNDYLIVIPRVFRAGTKMNIGVNIFGNKGCDVEVRVYDGTKNVLISQARDRFQPNEAGTLELPALEKASSTLKMESTVCGVRTKKKSVKFVTFENKVFIQTDKPIYKPGQKVLIRIISVDPKLKPAGKKISSVIIEEPNGAKIMQWKDVLMQDGFANLQLQLSEEPVLGKWLIKAIFEERTITKEIEIDQYVLPKFELEIKPPSYLALDQRRILFLICARYMYGKPVPGRLNATLCLKKYERNQNCLREYNNVTGCVEIDARELIDSATEQQYNRRYYLHIAAVFTESGTGVKVKETARSPFMIRKSKTMSFIDIAEKFKPGFPMTFKVKVSYRDGQPVTSAQLEVEVIVRHFHRDTSTRLLQKTYTVDNGTIEITLENVSHFAKRLDFMADYMSGELLIEKTSKAWYSPSLTYLKLVLPHRLPPKVGSEGSIKVMYTVPYNIRERIPFFYKILCKGNLARSDVIWVTTNWENKNRTLIRNQNNFSYNGQTIRGMTMNEFEIKFDVTQEMVPECRILVYYVRRDKETVGDSIFFDVEDTLENQQEKRPGDMTIIVIKAKPGSRIAISALDKSVFLLGETDEITKKDATEILRRQGAGRMSARDFSNCKGSLRMPLETDVSETFNNAGVVFFSSLRIFTQSCRPPLPTSAPSYDYLRPYGCFLGFRGNYGEAIELPLPTDVVPGSVLPKISIFGDIMGPALANFDGLLSMPGGCGEQNLAKFAPNIYILDYLTATNQITKKTKEDALRYITTGYQKELRYRRGEGEYSAFGSRDRKGSGMITAFLIRLYARARRHVFVDEDEIKQSVGWLKQKQKSSGCFPVNGQVFDRSLQGGVHRELIITAYTTIALLEAGFKNTTMVSNALDCILGKLDDTILNAYATSLATYTLILADHPKGGIMLSRLKNMAISLKGGQLYWSAKSTGSGASDRGTFSSVAADVETTGYALLSYLHHKEHSEDVTKIVKWLSKQRNHRGGFSSTQDTCVALQALSEVAEIYYWGTRR
ncbi:alpha-1-macroglobulin-like [Dendronephthya gigantea]|uniref:alpha-1-macroglobulin-like n=1 Tax=Dendronephthya gigantea TaxID=151771 RepID=UPI00106A5844|nr:alpha-1-macroglobulin-like [Dendronephthya gigantea]